MAILKNLIVAAALLSASAIAAPVAAINDRAIHIDTVTETDWVTIGITATVWINDADPTIPSAMTVTASQTETTTSVALVTSTSTPTLSPSSSQDPAPEPAVTSVAAPAPEPVASSSQPAAPAPETASPVVSPAGFAAASEPATSQTQAPAPAPAPATSSSAPPPVSTAPAVTSKDTAGSTSGTCEGQGNACVGDVTHWDGGLGACGWNVDTNSDLSIALPYQFMGTQSNGNPYCGRSLTLYDPATGKTAQAKVGDKCMGCVDRAIDLTNALFNAIVPGGDGRVHGIEWWFN